MNKLLTVLTIIGLAFGLSGCGDTKSKAPKTNGNSAIKPNLGHKEDRAASSKDAKAAPMPEKKMEAPKPEPKAEPKAEETKPEPKAEVKQEEPKAEPKAEEKKAEETK